MIADGTTRTTETATTRNRRRSLGAWKNGIGLPNATLAPVYEPRLSTAFGPSVRSTTGVRTRL